MGSKAKPVNGQPQPVLGRPHAFLHELMQVFLSPALQLNILPTLVGNAGIKVRHCLNEVVEPLPIELFAVKD